MLSFGVYFTNIRVHQESATVDKQQVMKRANFQQTLVHIDVSYQPYTFAQSMINVFCQNLHPENSFHRISHVLRYELKRIWLNM